MLELHYPMIQFLIIKFIQWFESYARCDWSLPVIYQIQIHGWRHGKLAFFVLFNMARGFENVCEIISDWGKWKLRKKFSRSYLQRRNMEKRRPNQLLTTWQCLLQEIFTTVAIVCPRYERLAVLQNVFAIINILLRARKSVKKLF